MTSASATIPVGYKQTEIGVIPEDWNVRKQGEIVDFINGRAYSRHEWETSGVPVCRLQNLTGSGDTFYYSKLKLPEKQYMEYGDLIFMWSASFGPYIWKGPRAIYHYHIWKIECNQKYVDKSFFYHALVDMTERLKSKTSGSTMLHLTKEGMEKYLLALPKLSEQKSISKVLTDSDSQILSLENLIAKKRDIKQGTMQKLLTGKTRLPGFSGEWNSSRLGDLLSVMSGKDWKNVAEEFGKFPVLGTGGVIGQSNDYLHDLPCVLIGRKGTIDRPQYMDTPFWCVDTIFYCEIKENNNAKFLYYMFCMIDWYAYNEASGVPSLNSSTIEKIRVSVPSNSEQEAIAKVLSDMDAEIAALEQRIEKTKAIKQGMMQQLLTGRIRLVDPSTPVEASA